MTRQEYAHVCAVVHQGWTKQLHNVTGSTCTACTWYTSQQHGSTGSTVQSTVQYRQYSTVQYRSCSTCRKLHGALHLHHHCCLPGTMTGKECSQATVAHVMSSGHSIWVGRQGCSCCSPCGCKRCKGHMMWHAACMCVVCCAAPSRESLL